MIYQYKCEACGAILDFDFPMEAEKKSREVCTECGNKTAYRVFGNPIIIPESFNPATRQIDFKGYKGPANKKRFY